MMLPTHALVGLAIATPLALVAPELGPAALGGALVGGILPDLDLYRGHRRTLHYPTLYPVAAVPAVLAAVVRPSPLAVAAALLVVAAAVHCQMDRLGGGLELRPWEGTSDRAVYDHVRGRWRRPRRLVAYDGSPGDLALAAGVGIPLVVVHDGAVALVAASALAIAATYVLLRRRLAALAPLVFGSLPAALAPYVPDRYAPD